MSVRLAERFSAARGAPIELHGKLVHMMYELPPIERPAGLRVEFERASTRPQAVRLKARRGKLLLHDQLIDDAVLWSDSAPPVIDMSLRPDSARTPMMLRVWNAWRDAAGTMQAWIGDAGILIEEEAPGVVRLRCSDGFDAPIFGDLVVLLTLTFCE